MDISQMRTWAECSEDAFVSNLRAVREHIGDAKLLCVVKANAYGHGAVHAAKILEREGAEYLGVSTLVEGLELREAGIMCPILVMCQTPPYYTEQLISHSLTQTVADIGTARAYSQCAVRLGKTLKCHLKIDTGMNRQGYGADDSLEETVALPSLQIEGLYTHFSVADEDGGDEFTMHQLELFRQRISGLDNKDMLIHAANSGATERFPQTYLDVIRPGLILYGYSPSGHGSLALTPVMELKTRIVQVKTLTKGDTVSYGRRYTAPRDMRIAVLPIGYADGLSRSLSGRFSVLVNGRHARQIGTICMDMCMVDVTEVTGVRSGDVVTVFGREPGFTARDMALLRETIPYEVLCNVSSRVPRVWVK